MEDGRFVDYVVGYARWIVFFVWWWGGVIGMAVALTRTVRFYRVKEMQLATFWLVAFVVCFQLLTPLLLGR